MKNKLVSNSQYTLAIKDISKISILVELLKARGYQIKHGLDSISSLKNMPVGICVDNNLKTVFSLNTTRMACFCTFNKTKPLYVEELIEHIDSLIDCPDVVFYNKMLRRGSKEKSRPGGSLVRLA